MPHGYDQLKPRGYTWNALYDLLKTCVDNFEGFLAKIDADTGDTTWATTYTIVRSIGSTIGSEIMPLASPQGKIVQLLDELRTNLNDVLDAMAADDGIDGTTVFTNQKFASTDYLFNEANARAKERGEFLEEVVLFLDNFVPQFNEVLTQCDNDATLTDTDYASTYAI